MGLYNLYEGAHKKMDTVRAKFFFDKGLQQIQVSRDKVGEHVYS